MKYKKYSVNDFVLDSRFRKWVLDPDESAHSFWTAWIAQNPHKTEDIAQARETLLSLPEIRHIYKQEQEDKLWENIRHQINNAPYPKGKIIPLNNKTTPNSAGSWHYFTRGGVAASLLIVLSFALAYFWIKSESLSEPASPVWIVKENPYGQRSTLYLSDGTEVILNAGSSLRYCEKFSAHQRRVELTGEAFFQVTKDTLRPFEVVAHHVVTRALGTSFNIKAFPEEPVQVSLVTGKVQVLEHDEKKAEHKGLILLPGESAISGLEDSEGLKKELFDAQQVLSWKEGVIYFQEADEKTVFTALERWYGVKIRTLNTSPSAWDYTGEAKNMSLEQFLQSLSYTMNFHYDMDGKQITITYDD